MGYKITYTINGIEGVDFFEADTREEAVSGVIEAYKELCRDPYGFDIEYFGFADTSEWLASIRFEDIENGFIVYYGKELQDIYKIIEVKEV